VYAAGCQYGIGGGTITIGGNATGTGTVTIPPGTDTYTAAVTAALVPYTDGGVNRLMQE
jgi:hypothetical protein